MTKEEFDKKWFLELRIANKNFNNSRAGVIRELLNDLKQFNEEVSLGVMARV